MSVKYELFYTTISKAHKAFDSNIHNNINNQHEFRKRIILDDNSLTINEKSIIIKMLNKNHDYYKIIFNEGSKRICEYCQEECLATLYCERCIQNYLQLNFSNWSSGNHDIDNLIRTCQMESIGPNRIVEWIPYNNLKNITYLANGCFSKIYSAVWIGGGYDDWDSKNRRLIRSRNKRVILRKLENVENANGSWFEEAKSYLTTNCKWNSIVKYYGLTRDLSDGKYILVMKELDINLRKYLQQNHNRLTWKEKIKITCDIIWALLRIHKENVIHRNLHSRNILHLKYNDYWHISDLGGFCHPVNKPLESIYGTLPYVAPEVIAGKQYTKASDIYSLAMIMWEISSEQSPFINYENDDYNFALDVINGMRPEIVSGTPLEYKELMKQCWDADPTKRPNINILLEKIIEMNKTYQQYENKIQQINYGTNIHLFSTSSLVRNLNSKIYNFKDLFESRNFTKAYHNMQIDLNIASETGLEQHDSPMLIDDEEINRSKRVFSRISDGDEHEDVIKYKKTKLNSNEDEL